MSAHLLHELSGRGQAQLRRLMRAFDARAPRERMVMALAATALCLLLADSLWLGQAYHRANAAGQRLRAAQAAGQALVSESAAMATQGTAQARQLAAEIAQWQQRLQQGSTALQAYEQTLVGADRMVELLEQMLPPHGRLRVVALRSLPRSDLLAASAAASAPTPGTGALPGLYRHGAELTIEGGYTDLMAYLQALESMPRRVLWGGLQMKAEQHPRVQLTLRLYTFSLDRGWLEI